MKDNEKKEDGIEEVVSQFEEASGEDDDEVIVCKLSDEAMQFVNQFPIEKISRRILVASVVS